MTLPKDLDNTTTTSDTTNEVRDEGDIFTVVTHSTYVR